MSKNIFLKHLLCLTVALCVVLSLYIPSLASEPIWMKKISDEVWNDQGDETGLKKIYVSRFTIDKELVETTFEEKYGYSLKKYENEAIYKMTVIPEVTERVNAKYGKDCEI